MSSELALCRDAVTAMRFSIFLTVCTLLTDIPSSNEHSLTVNQRLARIKWRVSISFGS